MPSGEPYDEPAILRPGNPEFHDQCCDPRDPPGNVPGVPRDPTDAPPLPPPPRRLVPNVVPECVDEHSLVAVGVSPVATFADDGPLHVEATVNGEIADDAPVAVLTGSAITLEYTVWTTGSDAVEVSAVVDDNATPDDPSDDFAAVAVTDSSFNVGDLDRDGRLDPGERWSYAAPDALGLVAPDGLRVDVATATAVGTAGQLTAADPALVYGTTGIRVDAQLNGSDSPEAPGLQLAAGTALEWTYEVTSEMNVALNDLTLVDDGGPASSFMPVYVGGDTDADGILDPGEAWSYTSAGAATITAGGGEHHSTVTASATTDAGCRVHDSDRTYYAVPTLPQGL